MGSSVGGSFTSCCGTRPESEAGLPNLYSGSSLHNKRIAQSFDIKLPKTKSEFSPIKGRKSKR